MYLQVPFNICHAGCRAQDEESVALNECLQLTYHQASRHHIILVYPREILMLDLNINQTVGIIPMERSGSPFIQVTLVLIAATQGATE